MNDTLVTKGRCIDSNYSK